MGSKGHHTQADSSGLKRPFGGLIESHAGILKESRKKTEEVFQDQGMYRVGQIHITVYKNQLLPGVTVSSDLYLLSLRAETTMRSLKTHAPSASRSTLPRTQPGSAEKSSSTLLQMSHDRLENKRGATSSQDLPLLLPCSGCSGDQGVCITHQGIITMTCI